MRLVFWTKEYNYHWFYIYKNLAPLVDGKITVIVQNELSEYRKQFGWASQIDDGFETTFLPRKNWFKQAPRFLRENRDAIHCFLGFTGKWCTWYTFPLILYSLIMNNKTIVMVEHYSKSAVGYHHDEPFIISWIKVKLRPAIYKLSTWIMKLFEKKDSLYFLAHSPLAKKVLIEAGIDPKNIFCFGYFIPRDEAANNPNKSFQKPLKAVYVGSLIKCKGVDLMLDALSEINTKVTRINFDIFGPGSLSLPLIQRIPGVKFKGILPQDQVQKTIARYDLLVLPSRHDGWGVVVNEALLQGVPVLVSDEAGASCLVRAMQAGIIFKSGNLDDLKANLMRLLDEQELLPALWSNAQKVGAMITPEIAAQYLVEIFRFYFESNRSGIIPNAIWCEDIQEKNGEPEQVNTNTLVHF